MDIDVLNKTLADIQIALLSQPKHDDPEPEEAEEIEDEEEE